MCSLEYQTEEKKPKQREERDVGICYIFVSHTAQSPHVVILRGTMVGTSHQSCRICTAVGVEEKSTFDTFCEPCRKLSSSYSALSIGDNASGPIGLIGPASTTNQS
jgi:hypothetical protein